MPSVHAHILIDVETQRVIQRWMPRIRDQGSGMTTHLLSHEPRDVSDIPRNHLDQCCGQILPPDLQPDSRESRCLQTSGAASRHTTHKNICEE
jgi:hypothetical protein